MTTRHIENRLADIEADLDNIEHRVDDFTKGIKDDIGKVRRAVHALREELKEPA